MVSANGCVAVIYNSVESDLSRTVEFSRTDGRWSPWDNHRRRCPMGPTTAPADWWTHDTRCHSTHRIKQTLGLHVMT